MVAYRELSGMWVEVTRDGPDADQDPDRRRMTGRGRLVPRFSGDWIVYEGQEFIRPDEIPVVFVNGHLMVELLDDDEDYVLQPVRVLVTVDAAADQVWEWELHYDDVYFEDFGRSLAFRPFRFTVPHGLEPLDLSTAVRKKSDIVETKRVWRGTEPPEASRVGDWWLTTETGMLKERTQ